MVEDRNQIHLNQRRKRIRNRSLEMVLDEKADSSPSKPRLTSKQFQTLKYICGLTGMSLDLLNFIPIFVPQQSLITGIRELIKSKLVESELVEPNSSNYDLIEQTNLSNYELVEQTNSSNEQTRRT